MKDFLASFHWHIHPRSIVVLIGLDLVWALVEAGALTTVVGACGIPLLVAAIFVVCTVMVMRIQQQRDDDERGAALVKGVVFGVIAAFPLCFTSLLFGSIYKVIQLALGGDKTWLTGLGVNNWKKFEKAAREIVGERKNLSSQDVAHMSMEYVLTELRKLDTKKTVFRNDEDWAEMVDWRRSRNYPVAHPFNSKGEAPPVDLWKAARSSEVMVRKYLRRLKQF